MKLAIWISALAACGTARGLEGYRTDTQKLLDTRHADIERCYEQALKDKPDLAGKVTVEFVVEKKTGMITRANINAIQTTAPKILGECVIQGVANLKLDPPDRDEGHATFVYEFKPKAGTS